MTVYSCQFHQNQFHHQMMDLHQMLRSVHPSLMDVATNLWVKKFTAEGRHDPRIADIVQFIFSLLPKKGDISVAVSLERFATMNKALMSDPTFDDVLKQFRSHLKIRPLTDIDYQISDIALLRYALAEKKGNASDYFEGNRAVRTEVRQFLSKRQKDMRLLPPNCTPELAESLDGLFKCDSWEEREKSITSENVFQILEFAEYSKRKEITPLCLDWIQKNKNLSASFHHPSRLDITPSSPLTEEAISFLNTINIHPVRFSIDCTKQNHFFSLLGSIRQLPHVNIELAMRNINMGRAETKLLLPLLTLNMKSLSLDNCHISQEDLINISTEIPKSTALHSLEIRNRPVSYFEDMCLRRLFEIQRDSSDLKMENLAQQKPSWNERFNSENIMGNGEKARSFARIIRESASLSHLALCDASIGLEGAREIVEALLENKSIRTLALEFHSSVKSQDLIPFLAEQCTWINELELTDRNLEAQTAHILLESIKKANPHLKKLEISADSFHRQSIASLK